MFDLILASFLKWEGMVQRMDGWHGRWLPNRNNERKKKMREKDGVKEYL